MSKHLEFIELVAAKPVYLLKKDMIASKGGKKNSTLSEILDCYITDITDEKIFVNGVEHRIKRVFVQSADSGSYADIGWVLNSEINYCMLCSIEFGFFTYQHHCKACGNVVCHNCSSNHVLIFELKTQGPLRVCNQCNWGQEIVYAVPLKSSPLPKSTGPSAGQNVTNNRRSLAIEKPKEVVASPVEDPEKVLKMQQQAEFQKQAIARISQGKLLKKPSVLSTSSRSDEENSPTVSARQPLSRINSISGNTGILGGAPVMANPMHAAAATASPAQNNTSPTRNGSFATTVSPMRSNSAVISRSTVAVSTPSTSVLDMRASSTEDLAEQQHAQRLQKMLSYGPLTIYSPTPAFVLKTKRNDLTKIFVNVCTHVSVPYKAEEPSSSGEAYDLNKVVYMLVGQPLEYQNEKDRSYCVIYDIVVHPDEVYVCSIDSTGIARNRLCNQSLELIAIHYLEALDPSYKILKISSNYKGKSESAAKTKTTPIAIPHRDAFYALSQMTTHTSDVEAPSPNGLGSSSRDVTPRDSEKSRGSISSSKQNSGRMSITAANAAAVMALQEASNGSSGKGVKNSNGSVSFISAGENSRSSALMDGDRTSVLEKNDSVRSNLDHALKVTVKPVALAAKTTNNNFNNVLEDLKVFQYNFRDIVITPEAGFVISAQRVNRGQQIFVNICHHPLVAMLSVKAASDKGQSLTFDRYPSNTPCPYVIGAIDNDFLCVDGSLLATPSSRASVGGGTKSVVIDVVIPSSVMLLAIQDVTGDLRDKLAIDMLENVSRLNVQFDSNFTLPLVAGGYVGKSPLIFPVINQTEEEKKQFVVSFVGKFSKQGHGVKSWKERLVQVVDSKLKYFDLNSTFKGDFNIDDCSVSYVPNAECSAPPDVYPFKMSNFVTGGEFMYCHVANSDLRELFSLVIITKTRQLSVAKDLITIPDLTTGWLKKQGHMVKNWKRRFFVLSYGVVKYYEKNGQEGRGSGENELGSVDLKGATVKVVVNSDISTKNSSGKDCRLSIVQSSGKDLLVEAESLAEKTAWFDALKKHILYANQYN